MSTNATPTRRHVEPASQGRAAVTVGLSDANNHKHNNRNKCTTTTTTTNATTTTTTTNNNNNNKMLQMCRAQAAACHAD